MFVAEVNDDEFETREKMKAKIIKRTIHKSSANTKKEENEKVKVVAVISYNDEMKLLSELTNECLLCHCKGL